MMNRRRSQILGVPGLILAVGVGWTLWGLDVSAAPPKIKSTPVKPAQIAGSATAPAGETVAEHPAMRLHYLNASWGTVLNDVAKASGLTLVAERVPSKKYTRRDKKTYYLPEALKILNQDLEQQGFRLIKKGNYLILMDIPSVRPEYSRPTAGKLDSAGGRAAQASEESNSGDTSISDTATEGDGTPAVEKPTTSRRKSDSRVTLVGHEGEATETQKPAKSEIPRLSHAGNNPSSTSTARTVRLKNEEAVPLAKSLYQVFKSRAELVDQGPQGLQAFRVFTVAKDGKPTQQVSFSVGINERAQSLVVEGATDVVDRVAQLIELLDRGSPGKSIQPVLTKQNPQVVADALQPELQELAAARRKEQRQLAAADENEESENGAAKKPAVVQERGQNSHNAPAENQVLEGLKGDVNIEAMSDMGVLILKGSQRDVDSVMQIIREIEKLSLGAAPDVHLVVLKHVNSESLASLLNGVYEKLSGMRGRSGPAGSSTTTKVTTIAVVKPNALLVLASQDEMANVTKLIGELDQPVPPDAEYQVFRLKFTTPARVEEMVSKLYPSQGQNAQPTGLASRIRIHGDVRTNSVIAQARPRDLKELESLILKIDTQDSDAVSQLKIIPLKHANADELALTLRQAILSVTNPNANTEGLGGVGNQNSGGGRGNAGANAPEGLNDVKSTILQFLSTDGGASIRSGILSDIRVNSDTRTNSLVLSAPEQSMSLLEALIKTLDRPASAVAEIRVFELSRGDATSMARLLTDMFGATNTTNRTGTGAQNQNVNRAITLAGTEDAGVAIPLKVSVDVRTNSIIAVGSAQALLVAESILLRLDQSDVRQRETKVFKLKNSQAQDVADAVNQFLASRRDVDTESTGLVSPFEQIEREVVVVPEVGSNSLVISATPRFFKEIQEVIEKLDEAPKQVIIQALLVEVSLDNVDEFGVELGLQDSILFRRSAITNSASQLITVPITGTLPNGTQTTNTQIISQSAQPGYLFNNQTLGNNTNPALNSGAIGNQGLSNFQLGRVNSDLGYGGFVFSASSESVSVLLRALAANRRVDILSRPQIRALDNKTAQIQVGQEVPRVSSFSTNQQTGVSTPMVDQTNTGIILIVTPRVTPDKMIVMEVAAEKSQIIPGQGIDLVSNPNGSVVRSPIKDVTIAQTTVGVHDGQTIVLGGMITKSDENFERKVPYLGDIPVVGTLFRYDFNRTKRTELLIFLTPRVISSDEENELIKQVEAQRTHFVESDAEQIHGPILAAPAAVFGEPYDPGMSPLMAPPEEDDPSIPSTSLPGPLQTLPTVPVQTPPAKTAPAAPPANPPAGTSIPAKPPLELPKSGTIQQMHATESEEEDAAEPKEASKKPTKSSSMRRVGFMQRRRAPVESTK